MARSNFNAFDVLSVLFLSLLMAGCGGGGGDGDAAGSAGASASTAVVFTTAPTLSGVAAVGAPLLNASVSVVDGSGAVVGSATTQATDGAYSLTLSSKSLTAPLLVQVRGLDAGGTPQVLHSAVPVLSAASAAMVANITPLSDAIVALAAGADPQPVFAAASQNAATVAQVATAASAAGEFVKGLVKTQLSDLKIKEVDLLGDPSFAANKGAQDLLLESLRINLSKSAAGLTQLQLANKLLPGSAAEVVVGLAAAQTELLKSSGGVPANAIVSTLKATTSSTATLAGMASLDELTVALNKLIVQSQDASTIAASKLLLADYSHGGRSRAELAAVLAGYGQKRLQFGRLLATGCADEALTAGLCTRLLVAAPLSDASGAVVAVFSDALRLDAKSTTGSKWNLIGNGKLVDVQINPLGYLALAADASLAADVASNPSIGLQVEIQAESPASVQLLAKAFLQTPGGFSIPFAYCRQVLLCLSTTAAAAEQVPTGGLADTALQQAAAGWIGGADTLRGAKYQVSYSSLKGVAESRAVYLKAEVLSAPARARFPVLDGVGTDQPLRAAALLAGLKLTWASWAAANPDMRLIKVRTLISSAAQAPLIKDVFPGLPVSSGLSLDPLALTDGVVPTGYELWLSAQDSAGRRYLTRYSVLP